MKKDVLLIGIFLVMFLFIIQVSSAGIFDFLSSADKSIIQDSQTQPLIRNIKNMSKYVDYEVFLISNRDWHDVLSLVPLTTWTEGTNLDQPEPQQNLVVKKYPALIYHEDKEPAYENLALNKPARASHNELGWDPYKANDNAVLTGWTSSKDNAWWEVDILNIQQVDRIEIQTDHDYNYIYILGSLDGQNYFFITQSKINPGFNRIDFERLNIRYLKVDFGVATGFKTIMEFRLFSTNSTSNWAFDADSSIHFMQMYWKSDAVPAPKKLTIVGSTLQELDDLLITAEPLGADIPENQIQRISPRQYFSYWSLVNHVVAVDYNDYKAGLIASEYASLINAPLIFIHQNNIHELDFYIKNKKVYFISSSETDCSSNCPESYYQELLDMSGNVVRSHIKEIQRRYIELTNTDKIVLVNPNDRNIFLQTGFQPEKSSHLIYSLFGEHSLAAPFLASAKHEIIFLEEINESPQNESSLKLFENAITIHENLKKNINKFFSNSNSPNFLTILSAPKAIPLYFTAINIPNFLQDPELDGKYSFSNIYRSDSAILSTNNHNFIGWSEDLSLNVRDGLRRLEYDLMLPHDFRTYLQEIDPEGVPLGNKIELSRSAGIISKIRLFDFNDLCFGITYSHKNLGEENIYYNKICDGTADETKKLIEISTPSVIVDYKIRRDNLNKFYILWEEYDNKSQEYSLNFRGFDSIGNPISERSILASEYRPISFSFEIEESLTESTLKVVYNNYTMNYLKTNLNGQILEKRKILNEKGFSVNTVKNQNNDIIISWIKNTSGEYQPTFTKFNSDGTIEPNKRISQLWGTSISIKKDSQDNLYVFFTSSSNSFFKKLDPFGNPLTNDIRITGVYDFSLDSGNNLNIISQGNSQQVGGTNLFYKKIDDEGNIITDEKPIFNEVFFNSNVGRIYSISLSDISSYIAKSIFYDKLIANLYPGTSTGLSVGRECYGNAPSHDAKHIRDKTKNSGYNSICSADFDVGCDHYVPYPQKELPSQLTLKKQFITYQDHGGPTGWEGFQSENIPWLYLSWSFGEACLTNGYYKGFENTFGVNMIRKGGIAYHGAVATSYFEDKEKLALKILTQQRSNQITLGELNKQLFNHPDALFYSPYFIMLGDPTLILNLNYVNWN